MQRGRSANSMGGGGGGGMPCPGEMPFLSSAVMGRRWHWGPTWRAWQPPPKPEHPPGAAARAGETGSLETYGLLLKSNLQLGLSQSSYQALAQSCGLFFFFLIEYKVCGFNSSAAR